MTIQQMNIWGWEIFYRIWHKRIYKSLTWSVSETDFGCAKWDKWGDINNEESD